MPFEEGKEKTGGRQKGTPNRTTQEMRDVMSAIHNKYLAQLEQDLDAMSPMNRWTIITKLAPFHMATLSKNENTNQTTEEVTIRVRYMDNPGVKVVEDNKLNNLVMQEAELVEKPSEKNPT